MSKTSSYKDNIEEEYRKIINQLVADAVATYMKDFRKDTIEALENGKRSLAEASTKLESQHTQLQPQVASFPKFISVLENIVQHIEITIENRVIKTIQEVNEKSKLELRKWIWGIGVGMLIILILQITIIFR